MSDRTPWFAANEDPDSLPELRGYSTADEAFDLWREQRLRQHGQIDDYE